MSDYGILKDGLNIESAFLGFEKKHNVFFACS